MMAFEAANSPSAFTTPHRPKGFRTNYSDFSSPSASSPQMSSPLSAATERRRTQYKSMSAFGAEPSSPSGDRRRGALLPTTDAEKAAARKRFQDKCLARAKSARREAVRARRRLAGEEDDMMDDEQEEDDETVMNDQLFQRVVEASNARLKHQYEASYEREVGSSPIGASEIDLWEDDCRGEVLEFDPEEAEIAAYAEEYERMQAEEQFADVSPEDMFGADDFDDFDFDLDDAMNTS
ncbi:hypothetical protein CYLTODRAFT_486859 [Cylindrobasidium torrendii FP15055 ss-10]|uniref:Uncharacterized protein n=1 Tax=Cylindrobasidium torrendii FP15055 ss-10 TaxID=1314674 RepID=A0A0D7BN83_9AGAR|nr:hypothetical protein CYLTODRAFT_486859 [Cylindrobasidium torrendii FP15055 ss-10]